MEPGSNGLVYIVQPAELVGTDRYKIGMSAFNTLKRFAGYKNGTRYLCIMETPNAKDVEDKLKERFNTDFSLLCGREFYSGEESAMIRAFLSIVILDKVPETPPPPYDEEGLARLVTLLETSEGSPDVANPVTEATANSLLVLKNSYNLTDDQVLKIRNSPGVMTEYASRCKIERYKRYTDMRAGLIGETVGADKEKHELAARALSLVGIENIREFLDGESLSVPTKQVKDIACKDKIFPLDDEIKTRDRGRELRDIRLRLYKLDSSTGPSRAKTFGLPSLLMILKTITFGVYGISISSDEGRSKHYSMKQTKWPNELI